MRTAIALGMLTAWVCALHLYPQLQSLQLCKLNQHRFWYSAGTVTALQACCYGEAPGYWRTLAAGRRQWALYDDTCVLADLLSLHLQVQIAICMTSQRETLSSSPILW